MDEKPQDTRKDLLGGIVKQAASGSISSLSRRSPRALSRSSSNKP